MVFLVSNICFMNFDINYYLYENFSHSFYYDIKKLRKQSIVENDTSYILLVDNGYKIIDDNVVLKEVLYPPNTKISSKGVRLAFNNTGTLVGNVYTFIVGYKDNINEITITPVSGRVLLKE
ncbi:MAG: hypothetical protein R3Y64_02005 [Peptostreptococcaceae bacterium]